MKGGGNTAITPGTDETELADVTSGGASPHVIQLEYGTTTTINWSWSGNAANAGVAVEYAQAAAGGDPEGSLLGGKLLRGGLLRHGVLTRS